MDTSEGVTWPSVITDVAQLPVAYTQENPEGIKWPWVTSGSHVTTTKKKVREKTEHAQNLLRSGSLADRASSGDVTTSGQKAPLGRILRNFRLRMRTFGDILPDRVTFGHGTSGSTTSNATLSVPIYYSSILSWSFIVLAQWNSEQSVGRHVAPHGHIILIPSQQVVALPP